MKQKSEQKLDSDVRATISCLASLSTEAWEAFSDWATEFEEKQKKKLTFTGIRCWSGQVLPQKFLLKEFVRLKSDESYTLKVNSGCPV